MHHHFLHSTTLPFSFHIKTAAFAIIKKQTATTTKFNIGKPLIITKDARLNLAYASYEFTKSYTNDYNPAPLVIMHDLLSSKNNWNSICKKFHKKNFLRKIYAIDCRNHGESPHSRLNSYDDLTLDLRNFLIEKNLKKVCLIGHCLGGRTAMLFALKFPEMVEKLVVIDVSPFSSSSNVKYLKSLLEYLNKMNLPKNVTLHEAVNSVTKNLSTVIKNKTIVMFLLTNLVKNNDGSFSWRFNGKSLLKNLDSINSFPYVHNLVYKGRVLFVGGSESDHLPKSDFSKISQLFPNAELKYINGAGHWVHSEKPEEFLKLTLNFLNKPN